MKVGDAVLAYPSGKSSNPANLVQLIKLDEKAFKPPTDISLTDKGFVAYSAICTHLGCTVSWMANQESPACIVHGMLLPRTAYSIPLRERRSWAGLPRFRSPRSG